MCILTPMRLSMRPRLSQSSFRREYASTVGPFRDKSPPRGRSRGGGPRLSHSGPRKSCRSRSRKPLPRAGRQAQPEPSRPLPLTAIIGRTGHFIDALIFRQAGGDETYGGEGGCDVKDVMDFQPNEYLTKITQEWKWRDGVRWEGTCVRFPATV